MSTTKLNSENIMRKVFDPATESLKTTSTAIVPPGVIEVAIDASTDSIRIEDGSGDTLNINSDGSINVVSTQGNTLSFYNEVISVASGIETGIISYVITAGSSKFLKKAQCSGENIGVYELKINGTTVDKKRTYYTGGFNVSFDFSSLPVSIGDVVSVTILHNSTDVGNFNARIEIEER